MNTGSNVREGALGLLRVLQWGHSIPPSWPKLHSPPTMGTDLLSEGTTTSTHRVGTPVTAPGEPRAVSEGKRCGGEGCSEQG